MSNFCLCGAQAGYPHKADCPYPEFKDDAKSFEEWDMARFGLVLNNFVKKEKA